jgi:hypothetical protein
VARTVRCPARAVAAVSEPMAERGTSQAITPSDTVAPASAIVGPTAAV